MGKTRGSFQDITEEEGFAAGVTEKRKEIKFRESGKRDWGYINSDRLRRGKNGTKVIIDNVDGGHEGVSRDNGMEKSVGSGKGGCVGPYFVVYFYSVSSYRPPHSPQSIQLAPLLLHHPLKASGLEKRGADSTDECPGRVRAYTVSAGKAGTGAHKVRCSRGRRS